MNNPLKKTFQNKQLLSVMWRKENFLLGILLLTVALNCLRVVQDLIAWYSLGSPTVFHGDSNSPGFTVANEVSPWSINTKLRIAVALIVIALTLYFKTAKSKTILILALLWIIGEYILWWYRAYNVMRYVEKPDFSAVPNVAYLIDGTWLDLWILGVAVILLAHILINLNNIRKSLS